MSKFPHMSNSNFPGIENADASRYLRDSEFDYKKYDKTQMRITICSVPWDVGLIHVGNAQIGGLGNVVKFEDKATRDAWFDSIEDKYTWDTQYREYHTDGFIEVDLPYEKCVLYNYVFVEYTTLPVEGAEGGKERFHFFIRECESLAPSNCRIKILRDTWQDYIYDIDVSYMMLERGHAAMVSGKSVDDYLANPVENNDWLLCEDVNYGSSYRTVNVGQVVLNHENMMAVIVTSANLLEPTGQPHEEGWVTPDGRAIVSGQPSMHAFGVEPERLPDFLNAMEDNAPQLFQTVKAVFFISENHLIINASYDLWGFSIYSIEQASDTLPLMELDKSQFGYDERYADLAKLYTYPYAYIELVDESGNVSQIRIEETSGTLDLVLTSSIAYPWISLDGVVTGIGSNVTQSVTFSNVTEHSFTFGGEWYKHMTRWDIPTFGVEIAASVAYDYETHFERKQREREAKTGLNNAVRSAETAKENANESAALAYDNAIRSADTARDNALASNETAQKNANTTDIMQRDNAKRSADTARDNALASNDTAQKNANTSDIMQRDNAKRSADTARDNALASNDTAKTNSDAAADIAYDNAKRSADTSKANGDRAALATKQNADARALTEQTNGDNAAKTSHSNQKRNIQRIKDNVGQEQYLQTEIKNLNNWLIEQETEIDRVKNSADAIVDVLASRAITEAQNEATAVTAGFNAGTGIVGNAAMGAVTGATAGSIVPGVGTLAGAIVGGVGGLAAGIVDAAHTGFTSMVSITTNTDIAEVTRNVTRRKINNAVTMAADVRDRRKQYNDSANAKTQQNVAEIATRNKTTDDQANDDSKDTTIEMNRLTKETDNANNERTYTATTDNNATSHDAAVLNAKKVLYGEKLANENIKTTADANAGRSHGTATTNADKAFEADLANNTRSKTTADANAGRTHETASENALASFKYAMGDSETGDVGANEREFDTAIDNGVADFETKMAGIEADINQAALSAPKEFGSWANGDTSTTRPIAMFANVVTQSDDAIAMAGDYFLRFGYACERAYKFETFNLMPKYTYWKASDMWISGNNVPDAYLDEIRFFLLGGVCVWNDPSDIGHTSIYENR